MVPPQHYPAAFPQEFTSARTPTMMTPDSSADTRSGRLSLDMGSVHQHHHHHLQQQQQEYNHRQLQSQSYHNGQLYHSPPYPLLPTPMDEHGQSHTTFTNQGSFVAYEQRPDQTETGSEDTEIALVPGNLNDGRLKRVNRHVSIDIPPNPLAPVTREMAGMPAKKKAKADTSKRGESDTASLFQKIFADRDPGKRKIRTKSVSEIPMDLGVDEDDSDFEDTKMDSNDEDEDMTMPDDAASEDEIKPDQQEALIDEQDLLTVLWQWKDNDPEVCCVCLGRSTEADNVFVYCDTLDCALCVHQACYGVKTLPSESEPWLCDRCKAPPEEVVSCVCCPSKDGAFRRLVPEDPSGGWVHVVCALWLPETTLGDPDNVDRISVRDIPEKNWNLTCYMCKDPVEGALGACVQCDAGQCRKSFHVTCAQSYSLLETLEDSDMADPYFMYCKQHGSTDGQAKLNGWAKWVKQRDAFLSQWQLDQGRKRTQRLLDLQQQRLQRHPDHNNIDDEDESGEGLIEFFEHNYSRFKQARERRITRERSELSRQYSIGYYLENKIEKTRSRLEVISSKAEQALQERIRIETYTRNLLSSLLECANYLENVASEDLVGETPLSIDTTLTWYNSLPDTSRWKNSIQDIIQTIDFNSLGYDHPFGQPGGGVHFSNGIHGPIDSGFDDSEGGQRQGRSSKGVYSKMTKKGSKAAANSMSSTTGHGKNAKSKKVHPKPVLTSKGQIPVVFTSSRGRLIKRDYPDHDDNSYSSSGAQHHGGHRQQQYGYHPGGDYGSAAYPTPNGYSGASSNYYLTKAPRSILPCTVCHQLTLPEEKLALERDSDGLLTPMAIKVLNRMVTCDTCQRPYHPKCLDPPMARVPPRGYSWNCEDCDSSDDSQNSSAENSSAMASHNGTNGDHHHHHTHSSDMEEALMFLADTALTVSTTPYGGATGSSAAGRKSTTHGQKRPHVATTIRMPDPVGPIPRGMTKKIKVEGGAGRKSINPKDTAESEVEDEDMEESEDQVRHPKPRAIQPKGVGSSVSKSSVAPIIRGNLRIYPPGPHISPKVSPSLLNIQEQEDTTNHKEVATKKTKAAAQSTDSSAAGKGTKGAAAVKKEGSKAKSAALNKTSKVKAEPAKGIKAAATSKGKKGAEAAAAAAASAVPAKAKGAKTTALAGPAGKKPKSALKETDAAVKSEPVADSKVTKRRKSASIAASSPTSPTSPSAGTFSGKEKATPAKSAVRRGSLPAVPPEPTPPPKEVIRYTVGEKTVEELTAKEDVEIERRDNVKFRKLRGRTLTMPAPPQDGIASSPDAVASTST